MVWSRVLIGLLIVVNLVLAYQVLVSNESLFAYIDLRKRYEEMERRIADLDEKNLSLSQEIRLLKSDRDHIERMIREQLNFVRQDEMLYVFPNTAVDTPSEPGADEDKN